MRLFILLFLFGLVSTPIVAKTMGKATFKAEGKGLAIDITGEGAFIDANIKRDAGKVSGIFTVKLADFKTGIALRDEHMCKALLCEKYPVAIFTLTGIEVRDGETPFTGTLNLAGKTSPFSGTAKFKGSQVSAKGVLKLTDFGITPPDYKAASVSNEVEVTVEIAL